jgi:hypothetical protein
MIDEETIRRKKERLAAGVRDYFWRICAELTARWKEAMLRLPPSVLRDLVIELREVETVTTQTDQELKAAGLAVAQGRESAEYLLDRALASMEHLNEVAEDMTQRLDELLKA